MPTDPDPRSPLETAALQAAAGPDWRVELYDALGSTNAVAAAEPAKGRVVVTEHQTAGRGRLDRVWETPRGSSLTLSAVVDPQLEPRWWPLLPLMTGLAVARAVGPQVGLKWPNDALIDGRKICGILVERVEAKVPIAVIGVGLNVSQTREELPIETATSLALEGLDTDRTEILGRILQEIRWGLGQLLTDPHNVVAAYRGRSLTLDQRVRVALPDGSDLVGQAFDIDDQGQLVVLVDDGADPVDPREAAPTSPDPGRLVVVSAGDVVHVRPL